jgi:hypothetical protein
VLALTSRSRIIASAESAATTGMATSAKARSARSVFFILGYLLGAGPHRPSSETKAAHAWERDDIMGFLIQSNGSSMGGCISRGRAL